MQIGLGSGGVVAGGVVLSNEWKKLENAINFKTEPDRTDQISKVIESYKMLELHSIVS